MILSIGILRNHLIAGLEIARVCAMVGLGHKRCLVQQQIVPVDAAEQRVLLHLLETHAVRRVGREEAHDRVDSGRRELLALILRPFDHAVSYVVEDELGSRVGERRDANEEFVGAHAQCPPVHAIVVLVT